MLTVYQSDIEGFSKDDWGDLLDNPSAPLDSRWEGWNSDTQTRFETACSALVPYPKAWEDCPVKEFVLDLEHKGEKVEYSRELDNLLSDLASLEAVKRGLYRLRLYDQEFEGEMDSVVDEFCGAYDRALARALPMLLKELYAARGE